MNLRHKLFDRGLTIAYVAVVGLAMLWTLGTGVWIGTLHFKGRIMIIHLPQRPVWSPPESPPYSEFQTRDETLPLVRPHDAGIRTALDSEAMLLQFSLLFWVVSLLFAMLSLSKLGGPRALGVCVIRFLAIGLSGAAAACVLAWLVFGGWGPPAPLLFAALGLICGICGGIADWQRFRQ